MEHAKGMVEGEKVLLKVDKIPLVGLRIILTRHAEHRISKPAVSIASPKVSTNSTLQIQLQRITRSLL